MKAAEQIAREIADRMGVEDAGQLTAGDVVELANLVDEVRSVRRAVMNPGPVPEYHLRVEAQARKEWPVLWKAIDALVSRAEKWDTDAEVEQ